MNWLPLSEKVRAEKSASPATAAIKGVIMSATRPSTTLLNATPITTPTPISTTFPRSRNCLNSSNIAASSTRRSQ